MASKSEQSSWMYMNTRKKKTKQINLPPISQVPGIGHAPDEDFPNEFGANFHKPGHIIAKSTDSKFNILCKKGGRADLLTHRAFVPKSKDPVPYERCDWFYQLDRDLEEKAEDAKKHSPKLPNYMVHKEFVPSKLSEESAPKENKIKVAKKVVVNPPYKVCTYTDWYRSFPRRKYFRSKLRPRESHDPYRALLSLPQWDEDIDAPHMSKLMANTYSKEWEKKQKEWATKFETVNRHNMDVMKKIIGKELSKQAGKPFDSAAWFKKSVISSIANIGEYRKRESTYQSTFNKYRFKPTLINAHQEALSAPFPRFPEDTSPVEISKLIQNQYAKEYQTKAAKFREDIRKYVDDKQKEKKPFRMKAFKL